MGSLKRPPVLAVGQRVRFEDQVRGALEVTAQAAVLEDTEAPHRVVALIDLFEAPTSRSCSGPNACRCPRLLGNLAEDHLLRTLGEALDTEAVHLRGKPSSVGGGDVALDPHSATGCLGKGANVR